MGDVERGALEKLGAQEFAELKKLLMKFRATLNEYEPEIQLDCFLLLKNIIQSMGYIVEIDPRCVTEKEDPFIKRK